MRKLGTVCVSVMLAAASTMAIAQPLPDLVPDITDWTVNIETTVAGGDVAEGCAESTSGVDLLRFSVQMWNEGSGDLTLGEPMCPTPCSSHPMEVCGNDLYICSPAQGHNHAHYANFSRYELVDPSGETVVVGHKQGYCVRDVICSHPKFTCSDQGITAGCADAYESGLGCQYLDVTNVPGGTYTLRVTVDPLGQITEENESNNSATVDVTIPDRPGQTPRSTPTATQTPGTPDVSFTATPEPTTAAPEPTTAAPEPTTPDATPTPVPPTEPPPTDTPMITPSPLVTCAGDCNADGAVTIDDVLVVTNIALGEDDVQACAAGDVDGSGTITVDEILLAVGNALAGCAES